MLTLEHDGRSYTVGLGFFADSNLAEIFLNSAKIGTDLATADQDAAVVLSLALQHGCPVETIRRALARNPNGTARGVIGVILDRLAAEAEG